MLDTVRNRPVTDTANSPASARKSPERSTASAPGSRSRRRRKMNTPASTSTAAMSRAWNMNQPTMLSASKLHRADLRQVHLVVVGLLADALEVQQSQRQRERDQRQRGCTPRTRVGARATAPATGADEPLGQQLRRDQRRQRGGVAGLTPPERIPASPVQHRRRRSPQPHRIPVHDAEHREHDAEQVADERGVEPHQPVAADERQRHHDGDRDQAPCHATTIQPAIRRAHVQTLNPRPVRCERFAAD